MLLHFFVISESFQADAAAQFRFIPALSASVFPPSWILEVDSPSVGVEGVNGDEGFVAVITANFLALVNASDVAFQITFSERLPAKRTYFFLPFLHIPA